MAYAQPATAISNALPKLALFLVLLLLLPLPLRAQQRPLLTEDPRIIPFGALVSEVGVTYLDRARFPLSQLGGNELSVPVSGLHFSLGERAEFQMVISLHNTLWVHENGTGTRNDWGDLNLSTKMKIVDERRFGPIISFRPTIVLPNSNDQKGIGTNTTQFFGTLLFGKNIGRLFVFGNAGLGILDDTTRPRAQEDVLPYGVAAMLPIGSRVRLVSEVNGVHNPQTHPTPGGEDHSQVRFGAQVQSHRIWWDFAGTAGLTRLDHRSGVVIGMTKEFRLWK